MATKIQDIAVQHIPSAASVNTPGTSKRNEIVIPSAVQSTAAHCATRTPGYYDYVILDPAATEFNRGGFCYMPYLLCNALKEQGKTVYFVEDFTVSNLDALPDAGEYLVAFWSATQEEAALVINRFNHKRPKFFGYYAYPEAIGLDIYRVPDEMIKLGMVSYPKYYYDYKFLLLSDCDTHLEEYSHLGAVFPLFLSYGCFRRCVYCPSAINNGYKITYLELDISLKLLDDCYAAGIRNIHFTDEEFFGDIDRTHAIFSHVAENLPGMYFIVLGSMPLVAKYLKKYGKETLVKAGLKVVEIGFEAADEDIQKGMLKPASPKHLKTVLELGPEISIFWLCISFYPGETLSTLNETGDFLRNYGLKRDKLVGRIATNATAAGLGQFFQMYPNAPGQENFRSLGETLTERAVRLIPSFVPYSFLNDVVAEVNPIHPDDYIGFFEYRLHPDMFKPVVGKTVRENVDLLMAGPEKLTFREAVVFMALSARVGAVKGEKWVGSQTNIKRYYDYINGDETLVHQSGHLDQPVAA